MSFKLIVFACLMAVSQSRNIGVIKSHIGARIISGRDAKPGEFPHQVSLMWGLPPIIEFQHLCGGTILTEKWILTAVHCLDAIEQLPEDGLFVVKAGKYLINKVENTEQMSSVAAYYKHTKYNSTAEVSPYDIALIKLETPLKLTKQVATIRLPQKNVEPNGTVVLSGWGSITNDTENPKYPHILQTVQVPIVPRDKCNAAVKKVGLEEGIVYNDLVDKTNICTGPLDGGISGCNGDSGGPLISTNKNGEKEVIGVVSWTMFPCARKGAPTVYVKVSSFIDWITDIITKH